MRILIDLPEADVVLLKQISKAEGISRAELVRRAITASLEPRRQNDKDALRAAFGIWADRKEDGLAYQERMRAEWSERSLTPTSSSTR